MEIQINFGKIHCVHNSSIILSCLLSIMQIVCQNGMSHLCLSSWVILLIEEKNACPLHVPSQVLHAPKCTMAKACALGAAPTYI